MNPNSYDLSKVEPGTVSNCLAPAGSGDPPSGMGAPSHPHPPAEMLVPKWNDAVAHQFG